MRYAVALVVAVVVLVPVRSEEVTPKNLAGTWTRTVEGRTIKFDIKEKGLTVTLVDGNTSVEAEAEYAITKDGVLFGIITKVKKTGTDGGPTEGELFSFKPAVEKGKLTISDLNGTKINDGARKLVEGEYSK